MEKIKSIKELREAILQLEIKQLEDKRLLQEQIVSTYESLRPVNLIKNLIKDIIVSPSLKQQIASTLLGLAAGYFTKKVAIGSSHSPLRKLLGSILQMGITNVVAKKSGGIKSIFGMVRGFLSKKRVENEF